ncbi:MAG: SpoIIE family protein phosphatase [Planctomycetaceae bacterium]|nr:SpoIIE family protein phosphatase [Planctomycetaceae bacterium]
MASLVILQGGEAKSFPLTQAETVLGRLPECTIQLESNMVSRKHARVLKEGDQFLIEDLGSGNGSLVNGKKVEGKAVLKHEDRIKLGPILLRFEADGAARPAVRRPVMPPSPAGGPTQTFNLDMSGEDTATIMGSVGNQGGFGMLDVRPEQKLKAVLEISKSLAGSVDLQGLLPRILKTLFEVFPHADRGCILLKDASGKMIPAAQKHRRGEEDATVKLSRTILNKVLTEKTGVLSADAAGDAAFTGSESISNLSIRSMMCVPMLGLDGEPMGVINIDTQNPLNQFKKEDLDLLLAVAGQAALSYESARLLVSHMERMKQESEMEIAKAVQIALLPSSMPKAEGYQFFACYEAAQAVGGDYYDAFALEDGRICLSFGDVAGKGVPGALVMSRMATVVQSTMKHVPDVGEAIMAINEAMCSNMVEGRFVTYVLGVIDPKTNEMTLSIAGHMSPIIRKTDGTLEEFAEDQIGLPIGVVDGFPYDVITRKIEPGELVVIYTDGVSEAMNPAGGLYGEDTVRNFVKRSWTNAEELGKALLADVRKHANGRAQNDDITIMAFGRAPA